MSSLLNFIYSLTSKQQQQGWVKRPASQWRPRFHTNGLNSGIVLRTWSITPTDRVFAEQGHEGDA